MSNLREVKPRVKTITLHDGVERELRFTLNAMAEMEDKYGSVDAAFDKLNEGSIKAARFIIWAGLMHLEDESLTEKRVGDLVDLDSMHQVMATMNSAMAEDMPQPDNNGNVNVPNV